MPYKLLFFFSGNRSETPLNNTTEPSSETNNFLLTVFRTIYSFVLLLLNVKVSYLPWVNRGRQSVKSGS